MGEKKIQCVKWCVDNEQGIVLPGLSPSSVTGGVTLSKSVHTSMTRLLCL